VAFKDHGTVADTLELDIEAEQAVMDELAAVGIDMQAVTDELLDKGVKAFADSFQQLLDAVEEKRQQFVEEPAV
jgi:transaldolase